VPPDQVGGVSGGLLLCLSAAAWQQATLTSRSCNQYTLCTSNTCIPAQTLLQSIVLRPVHTCSPSDPSIALDTMFEQHLRLTSAYFISCR
jgi:hypothetical protein